MTELEILDLFRAAAGLAVSVATPVLVVALAVGLFIGLFQALTSVQEMTLTFVPKLAAIAITFWMTMSYSAQLLVQFFHNQIIFRIADI